ncbi:alginate lyase family protein [Actinacidiphila glaucinigra]|uniref:alginate lyase family protein n=1 Tax=Actinacidiphila glaucinigra TaxID=235986 RepID=UPI0033E19D36
MSRPAPTPHVLQPGPPAWWPSRPSALTTRWVAVRAAGRGAQRTRAHAARILRTWFVDPATRTNPEPGNAQAIPCRCDGRAIGIIDFSQGLRRPARGSPRLDRTGPRRHGAWGDGFLDWLVDGDFGKQRVPPPTTTAPSTTRRSQRSPPPPAAPRSPCGPSPPHAPG